MTVLRLVLGDQLNRSISSLSDINTSGDVVLMCEVWEEGTYVKHHKKKIAFIFSAMRHFAEELKSKNIQVRYTRLNDENNTGSFLGELDRAIEYFKPTKVVVTEPSEYRVLNDLKNWNSPIPLEIRPDLRFLCTHHEFQQWAKGRKQLRMEYFYREMRKKYRILMDGDKPEGGEWNYDNQNRQSPKANMFIPEHYQSSPDTITDQVMALVKEQFKNHFGDLEPFYFAVTRTQALHALHQFIEERLIHFGDYQDAMVEKEPWMYHSHLSFYINCGLLLPLECIKAAEQAYYSNQAPLNAVEGFIRQILGWREYVRGIYWLNMPDYQEANFLEAKRPLPNLFWTRKTKMNCMKQCIQETKENAYAHHIQRLMVIGNFALIAGLNPDEVNNWFMIVYADAYQWVELPNVTGMILFADGGVLGSKPYAASGAYINKMSNYCQGCQYKVTKKNGEDACPFNYLYWDFLIRNKSKLRTNHRLAMIYKTQERMSEEKIQLIQKDSERFFKSLESGEKV
jgi:deoxyribodipyrimidine photolyase-related protein